MFVRKGSLRLGEELPDMFIILLIQQRSVTEVLPGVLSPACTISLPLSFCYNRCALLQPVAEQCSQHISIEARAAFHCQLSHHPCHCPPLSLCYDGCALLQTDTAMPLARKGGADAIDPHHRSQTALLGNFAPYMNYVRTVLCRRCS